MLFQHSAELLCADEVDFQERPSPELVHQEAPLASQLHAVQGLTRNGLCSETCGETRNFCTFGYTVPQKDKLRCNNNNKNNSKNLLQ